MWPADWDVFISYRHADVTAVKPIASALTERGLRVWFDADNLRAGETFDDAIQSAIKASTVTLCLVSRQYQLSTYCLKEYHYALDRRVVVRIEPGLELASGILENRESVPDDWSVARIVEEVEARVGGAAALARASKGYLWCNRSKEWEVLKNPKPSGKPRLILVPGDHFQAHDRLLERVRFFHELTPGQACAVEWAGRTGPAEQEYRDVLIDALVPPKKGAGRARWSRPIADLLKLRSQYAPLVLLHKPVDGDAGTPRSEHSLYRYYRWLASELGSERLPIICVQPVSWKTWTNWLQLLAFWRRFRERTEANELMKELGKTLTDWEVSELDPLAAITKADLVKYAKERGYPIEDFVAYAYDRRSMKTLDSIQTYRPSGPA